MKKLHLICFLVAVLTGESLVSDTAGQTRPSQLCHSIEIKMIPRVPLGAPLPEPMRQPLPEYPIKMRSQGIEGLVKVTVSIDESGVIDKVSVKEATSVEFESAVKEAISLWSFRPAKRGNEPCKSVVEFEFQFKYPMDE